MFENPANWKMIEPQQLEKLWPSQFVRNEVANVEFQLDNFLGVQQIQLIKL